MSGKQPVRDGQSKYRENPERGTGKSGERCHSNWRGRSFKKQRGAQEPAATAQKSQFKANASSAGGS